MEHLLETQVCFQFERYLILATEFGWSLDVGQMAANAERIGKILVEPD